MAYEKSARRFRPVGSRKKKAAPQYSPAGTGCPVVEQAVERLYREQNETHFWNLMNALNYALELKTRVLVPLDAAADPQSGPAPWASMPIPAEKAEGLDPWLLHTRKERSYLPLFTSVKTAEAERATATRPMAERGMREAMEYALNTDGIDGVVIDPWTNSATLDGSILNGLLKSERGSEGPGLEELDAGYDAARQGSWAEADITALTEDASIRAAAQQLVSQGVKYAVVTLKDSTGVVYYASQVPAAAASPASVTVDPARVAAIFREEGLIPVAKLAAFRDPAGARADHAMAIGYTGQAYLWLDNKASADGKPWLNP